MSGQEIDPIFATQLAQDVYTIKNVNTRAAFLAKYQKHFDLNEGSLSTGRTGGYVVNSEHVMALLCTGKGIYKGQAFVAVKGTASLYDALTDLNAGLRTSHTGFPIHQGFYYAFDSVLMELRQFVSKLQGITVIHCVGHSLGGAVATLAADWLRTSHVVSAVKLYTFGCPRVGFQSFASKCTSKLSSENIYRVYHKTDPVPMVPTWPFFDIPNTSVGYLLYSPVPAIPWEYHLMKHYIKSAKTAGSWEGMANSRPASHMDNAIESWLKSDGIVSLTASSLELLNAALLYVVKKVVNLQGIAMISAATTTLTFLDRMAILLAKGAKISADLSIWVYYLVRKMAALIGITIKEGTDLTVELIRTVFLRVQKRITDIIGRVGREVA